MANSSSLTSQIPSNLHFPTEEEKVKTFWDDKDAFHTCLKQSKGKPRFTFYDGPPFATGLPHYGHILAGTIKDIITRWKHQHGFHVERRFGWDTHGLPVEYEIDKTFNIKGPDDVQKMGIEAYNRECRSIVMRYSKEWESITARMGRWIDFKNDYKTLYPWYMESIWWVFRQLYDKGLIYKGFRVMPYSTGCATPLSNFEATQDYKEVQDPAITVCFPLDDEPDVNIIAWTTTPWTLPSNLALCVHPDLDYVKVKDSKSGKLYILMEARLSAVFKSEEDYEILEKFKGKTLENKGYKPLFDYFKHFKEKKAFRVLCDTYVTEDSGTGCVHQAPYFGEDDNRVCKVYGIVSAGDPEVVCPLDSVGRFVEPVNEFKGMYVKEADKEIIKNIKERGRLFAAATVNHNYPFCWRSDTPLLYRAVPSWFMRVEQMRNTLLARNDETYWVPEAIREGRFANWLKDARDWNISRSRYWGTPIPLWMSEDGLETVCIGSIAELEELSGVKAEKNGEKDLHRETIDKITIPSKRPGHPPLRRIPEVFDCWFESGSMPYAQSHYPFENKKEFEDAFPADFIAEGTDQTRGWFYTLLVLSSALFNKAPFKNLIVNGLVLAADGQKMSKRKKNYPDPMEVVNKYGADAVRLYLINSPVVKAETLKFKEEGVHAVLKDVFLPWFNAYRFLVQNVDAYNNGRDTKFTWDSRLSYGNSSNVMDQWIISFTQSLLTFVNTEMEHYRLYTVLPRLMKFIDNLTNWYVRANRKRLKGEGVDDADCKVALETLFSVLYTMVRVFAPFTPFLTEQMYQVLKVLVNQGSKDTDSVHYLMIPEPRKDLIHEDIERAVSRMQAVIELGRVLRDRKTMPLKYPLPELVVIHKDQQYLDDVKSLESYVLDELNIKTLTLSSDKANYNVSLRAEPDHKTLGFRLKGAFKDVTREIKALTDAQVTDFVNKGIINVLGHDLGPDDLRIMYNFGEKGTTSKYEAHSDNEVLVLLDCTPDQSMIDEGTAREVVNRIQKLRKKAGLKPQDEVTLYYKVSPTKDDLQRVISEYVEYIETSTKNPIVMETATSNQSNKIIEESYVLKAANLTLSLCKGFHKAGFQNSSNAVTDAVGFGQPQGKFVNIVHKDKVATVILQNPHDANNMLTFTQLCEEAKDIFGISSAHFNLFLDGAEITQGNINSVIGKTVTTEQATNNFSSANGAICPFFDITYNKRSATLLLQNPLGSNTTVYVNDVLSTMFGLSLKSKKKLKFEKSTMDLNNMDTEQWKKLYGKSGDLLL